LLLSWLHPDKNPSGARAVFAARVTGAWNDLRSPDRRAAYDAALNISRANRSVRSQRLSREPSGTKTNGTHLSLRTPSQHRHLVTRDSGVFEDDRNGLLRKGWRYLRRVLRDRTTS
jgi:curved DNA-binding protein CbpA